MREVWLEVSSTIMYTLKKIPGLLPTALVIVNPFVTLMCAIDLYQRHGMWRIEMLFVPLALLLLTYFANVAKRVVMMEQYGIPVARKRFTRRDERGHINFQMSELPEMVEYVAAVEEHCEKHGMYRRMKNTSLIALFAIGLALCNPLTVQAEECIKYERVICDLTAEEQVLIQKIALAEAENQGIGGMAFVMQVILNRIQSDDFPDTLEEVISQENQFSVYGSGVYLEKEPNENSEKALELLSVLLNRGALYFENPRGKENTWHSRNLEYVFEYEDHVFYK